MAEVAAEEAPAAQQKGAAEEEQQRVQVSLCIKNPSRPLDGFTLKCSPELTIQGLHDILASDYPDRPDPQAQTVSAEEGAKRGARRARVTLVLVHMQRCARCMRSVPQMVSTPRSLTESP